MKLHVTGPMHFGFEWFTTATITIGGIELLRRIRKGQSSDLGRLRASKDRALRLPSGTRFWPA